MSAETLSSPQLRHIYTKWLDEKRHKSDRYSIMISYQDPLPTSNLINDYKKMWFGEVLDFTRWGNLLVEVDSNERSTNPLVPSKLYQLSRHWNDLLQTHPNQWVAIDDYGSTFVGNSRQDAKQRAVSAGCTKPLIVYVSEDAWNTR